MLRDIHTESPQPKGARVLVMAASTRTGSINQALAHRIGAEIERSGEAIDLIDLAGHPMPLYHGDVEDRDGVPATAPELARRLAIAEVLVIVTPEYNGSFTPLLKNTVDWLTRVDSGVLAHLRVLVASASPGQGGGARAVDMIRTWMDNIGVEVAERSLSVGSAALADDGTIGGVDVAALADFAGQAILADARTLPWR